jgi:paraquat-inducible protein B
VGCREEQVVTDRKEGIASDLPKARSIHRRWPGLIWAVPLAALLVVGWLGLSAITERGIDVVVTFESAPGVTPGDTKVIVQGVQAGHVTHVRVAEDGLHVDVTLRLDPHESAALNTATQFWLIGAKPSFSDLSSLRAAVAGLSIGMAPQTGGTPTKHFVGLQEPPAITPGTKGTRYFLKTPTMGSVQKGSSILYRGQEIGKIANTKLLALNSFQLEIFINAPYDEFVRKGAEFWTGSPFALTLGDGGLQANLSPAANVLQGLVQFDLPDVARDAPRSPKDSTFILFASQAAAVQGDLGPPISYEIAFRGSAGDLSDGAKVTLLGVKVGEVRDVKLVLPDDDVPSTLATIVIFPAELNVDRSEAKEADAWRKASDEVITRLVAQGFRARLAQSPPLIGSRTIAIGPDSEARGGTLGLQGRFPRIPSAVSASDTDQLLSQANDILGKVNQIPFASIGAHLDGLTAHIDDFTGSPELKASLTHLDGTLRQIDKTIGPLIARLNKSVDQVGGAATAATGVLGGAGANQDQSLAEAIRQIDQAARSIRALSDYLGRHPEALIGGKTKDAR